MISAENRLAGLFDEGCYTELDALAMSGDKKSGVVTGYGYVEGNPVYAFSQDSSVNNGAMNIVHANKIKKLYELASKTGTPVVGFYDSMGADLTDGVKVMNAYGELLMWVNNLSGVVPQISVVCGTCSGSSALIALSGDFLIATKKAEIFVTPNTTVKDMAKNAASNGTATLICEDDEEAVSAAKMLISKLPCNNLAPVPVYEFSESGLAFSGNALDMAKAVCDLDSVVELYEEFGKASFTALGSINGATVGICATNKTDDLLNSDDCSKIARFVRTCDAFSIPVVTLVDTEGFELSDSSEVNGSVRDMAKLAQAYAEATCVKVSIVCGKAYGSSYIVFAGKGANADMVFAHENAVISPLAPLTAVEFLSHDKLKGCENLNAEREKLANEYVNECASAVKACENNCVDGIVNSDNVRATLVGALDILSSKRVSRLPKKHSNMPF